MTLFLWQIPPLLVLSPTSTRNLFTLGALPEDLPVIVKDLA
jgi:hypothetical protein